MGFMASLFSSAAQSGGDILSGLVGAGLNAMSANQQYIREKKLMQMQYDFGQKSLRESPSNYKQGLVDAGYNPMLAISNGIPNGGGTSLPQAPNADLSSGFEKGSSAVGNMRQRAAERVLMKKQEAEIQARIDNANADIMVKGEQANNIRADTALKNAQIPKTVQDISTSRTNQLNTYEGWTKDALSGASSALNTFFAYNIFKKMMANGATYDSAVKATKSLIGRSGSFTQAGANSALHASKWLGRLGVLGAGLTAGTVGYGIGKKAFEKADDKWNLGDKILKHGAREYRHPFYLPY